MNWDKFKQEYREIRNNNPCGVTISPLESEFVGITGKDEPLYIFDTIPDGLQNAALLLSRYYFGGNAKTLNAIAQKWTGSKTAYTGQNLSDWIGNSDDPDTSLDPSRIPDILYGLTCGETNQEVADFMPVSWFDNAYDRIS